MLCARFVCRGWEGSLVSFSLWIRILRVLLLSSGSALAVFPCNALGCIYLEAPVQCPLADTIDGFLDPVGCSGGVLRHIPDCQVVCM